MIIKNALVYTEDHKFEKKDVRIEDERIAEIAENGQITATDEDVIDGEGMYAIPGLVDIHFHGAVGYDFCQASKEELLKIAVFLAVGLPLTRFGAERNNFIKYLTKNKRVDFRYENEAYHIEIDDVAVFPQCYAAVVDKIPTMAKKTLVVDIGSWTIDIMPVINKSPDESKCVTVPRGLITCMRSINEQCVRQLNGEVDETEIQNIMRYGRSDIDDEYLAIIKAEIEDFVEKVYNSIREFSYNLKTTPIVFVGGGAVVMKNFSNHEAKNISYILDVKANARGYEQLAIMGLKTAKRLA